MDTEHTAQRVKRPLRVLVAASGSGGHLFPALHIAKALREQAQRQGPQIHIEFIGSGRPLEAKLVDPEGYVRHVIAIVGLKQRGIRGVLQFIRLVPGAVTGIWRLLRTYRPDVVVGVGGYVSVLPVVLAWLRHCPTWIHECELRPGLANWFLSFFATRISVAFENARMPFRHKVMYSGMPVRPGLRAVREESQPVEHPVRVLVMGGSQGSQALDEALLVLRPFLRARGVAVWHQCRPENVERIAAEYQSAGLAEVRVAGFIDDPVQAYRWCHLVIARSGASTVMEIGVVNKPAIFVPYPFAQGSHQAANARTLVEQGKALLVEEGPGFVERLQAALSQLLDPASYRAMRGREYQERSTDAAQRIAAGVVQLVQDRH